MHKHISLAARRISLKKPRSMNEVFFGPPRGILSRAAALSPRFARCHVGGNAPPEHFLPLCSLLVRIPLYYSQSKKTTAHKVPSFFWPAQRDSNPRSSESESAALSSCAMSGNIKRRHKRATAFEFILQGLFQARFCRCPLHCKDPSSRSSVQFCRGVLHRGRCL